MQAKYVHMSQAHLIGFKVNTEFKKIYASENSLVLAFCAFDVTCAELSLFFVLHLDSVGG